jgi:hypothetical protein
MDDVEGVVEYPELKCSGTVSGYADEDIGFVTESITSGGVDRGGRCSVETPEAIFRTATGITFGSRTPAITAFTAQLTRSRCDPSCTVAGRDFNMQAMYL